MSEPRLQSAPGRRSLNVLQIVCILLTATRLSCAAEEAPPKREPPKPWRPYKEIPECLYFESFESETAGIWDKGTVDNKTTQTPGSHSLKLVPIDNDKENGLNAQASFGALGAFRLLGGLKPTEVKIQYMIWSDVPGHVDTHFNDDKSDFKHTFVVNKANVWTPVALDLAVLESKEGHPKEATVLTSMRVAFAPQKGKACTTYIDDFVISHIVKPVEILPRLIAIDTQRSEQLRLPSRDGFSFNYLSQEQLEATIKTRGKRKPRTVLVMPSRAVDVDALKTALPAAAAKIRSGSEFKFVFAESPDGAPAAGLDDMHTLLQYNLLKSDAETALLILGASDVSGGGDSPSNESVRVIQERALELGCVPIICAAPGSFTAVTNDRTKLDRLWSAAAQGSRTTGAPWVDLGFAVKDNAAALDKGDLTAAGLQSLAELSMKALKHVDVFVFNRK